MEEQSALILEGSTGISFFLSEILLEQGQITNIHLCTNAKQAISYVEHTELSLIIIDLANAWTQGVQFGFWLQTHKIPVATILIVPLQTNHPLFSHKNFSVLALPFTLQEFVVCTREIFHSVNLPDEAVPYPEGNSLSSPVINAMSLPAHE